MVESSSSSHTYQTRRLHCPILEGISEHRHSKSNKCNRRLIQSMKDGAEGFIEKHSHTVLSFSPVLLFSCFPSLECLYYHRVQVLLLFPTEDPVLGLCRGMCVRLYECVWTGAGMKDANTCLRKKSGVFSKRQGSGLDTISFTEFTVIRTITTTKTQNQ